MVVWLRLLDVWARYVATSPLPSPLCLSWRRLSTVSSPHSKGINAKSGAQRYPQHCTRSSYIQTVGLNPPAPGASCDGGYEGVLGSTRIVSNAYGCILGVAYRMLLKCVNVLLSINEAHRRPGGCIVERLSRSVPPLRLISN